MAGTVQYASHANFFSGIVSDVPRHLIPEGAVYDAENIVITNSGSLAQRGPSISALNKQTSLAPVEIGAQKSASPDGRSRLYTVGLAAGALQFGSMEFSSDPKTMYQYNSTISGSNVDSYSIYGDSIVFPINGSGVMAWCGGADFQESFETYAASGVSITTSAGNNQITVGAAAVASIKIGGFVFLSNGGTDEYTGRVIAAGGSTITVDPAPINPRTGVAVTTYTSINYYPVLPQVGTRNDGQYISSAGCAGVFSSGGDSRILMGNVSITDATSGNVQSHPNRIVWSVREAGDTTVANCDGLVQATRAGFPALNYIDVQDIEQIVGLVPIGSGNMLVLGTKNCVMLSGYLLTQSGGATNASLSRGGITANIRAFSQQVGCLSAKSIQRTSAGVMFASSDGVYLTDGSALVNTMTKKIANSWGNFASASNTFTFDASTFDGDGVFGAGGSFGVVYGSANINDSHYYISLPTGGYLCDLRSQFGWTRVTSGQLEIASSTSDADQTTNRIYAIKQGTSTASAGFDRVIRIDPVVVPIEGSTDADGQRINSTITTRAYTDGDPAQKRRYRHTLLTYDVSPGLSTYPNATTYPSAFLYPGASNGAFVVNVTKGLDATGGSSTIGSITPTSTSAGVSRFDHQSLSQAVTYTISTAGFPTSFSMFEVTNGFNQLRPGRVV
jgi:hypothetical protein